MTTKLTAEMLDEAEARLGVPAYLQPLVRALIAAARASLESRGDAGTPTYVCDGGYGMSHGYTSCGWKSERRPAGGHCPVCRGCVAMKMLPLASAAAARPTASPALAAEARASARLDGETHCLPEEPMAGWISVSDRMPAPYEVVQFVTEPGDVRVGPRSNGPHWIWQDMTTVDQHGESDIFSDDQVTHWAPLLPSPPKVTP